MQRTLLRMKDEGEEGEIGSSALTVLDKDLAVAQGLKNSRVLPAKETHHSILSNCASSQNSACRMDPRSRRGQKKWPKEMAKAAENGLVYFVLGEVSI